MLTTSCTVDLNCSLNGLCVSGACVCDPGWRGPTCTVLDLKPAKRANGYHIPGTSSWGGSVIKSGGIYHMFVEELVNGCCLNAYVRNMRFAHAVSKSADGPYKSVNLVTNYSSSTPHALRDHNGDWLVFGTGCGRQLCPTVTECAAGVTASNATLYPGHCELRDECRVDWGSNAWRSKSPDGPWELISPILDLEHPKMAHADGTPVVFANPTVTLLPNGSATLLYRDYLSKAKFPATNVIGLARSHTGWRGPYTEFETRLTPGHAYAEDPFIYRDKRGNWHMLAHSLCDAWPNCPAVGGHACSEDGITWTYTSAAVYSFSQL